MTPLAVALCLAQTPAAPKLFPPDPVTAARIAELRAALDAHIAKLPGPAKNTPDYRPDVLVYAKAAEWVVRHEEWLTKDTAAQTVRVLEAGIARAKELANGRTPWRQVTGKPVAVGYRSYLDGSVQPVVVTYPAADTVNDKPWKWEVVLHGRDDTLTEVKFLARAEAAKPSRTPRVIVEPYGRGNNAYRWAGEVDVFEAMSSWSWVGIKAGQPLPDLGRPLLRGFSMGGAGTWHIGLHHPTRWMGIQPGAGFTTTRGYTKLPEPLSPHVEKMLSIYDAERYAENVFNLPTVAYSGEKDKQKAAADGIERALKGFPAKLPFTHVVAAGLEHKQPPEWAARCDAELAKLSPRKDGDRLRFVTYTPRYGNARWVTVCALDRLYEKAVIDLRVDGATAHVRTENVRQFQFGRYGNSPLAEIKATVIDGQTVDEPARTRKYFKEGGRWREVDADNASPWGCATVDLPNPMKTAGYQGPIDDAFLDRFVVIPPTGDGWHSAVSRGIASERERASRLWDKWLRGLLPTGEPRLYANIYPGHFVLFGDPASNPAVAKAVAHLPITWTRDVLEVNGTRYDPSTHYPALIYPTAGSRNSLSRQYVVLNSGHTFGEAEFRASNAQLFPRLGDWAVMKVEGDKSVPVAGGLFDENWQFPKK